MLPCRAHLDQVAVGAVVVTRRREEAALSAQLEDVRRNDDGAVEVLTGELVAMKLRAAELSNECDMLDHHATLVRRQHR